MDIAKIRKKTREADAHEAKAEDQSLKPEEDKNTPPDETVETYSEESPDRKTPAKPVTPPDKRDKKRRKPETQVQEDVKAGGDSPEETETRGKTGEAGTEEVVEILTFRLLKEEFAFSISHLEEILRYQKITSVPNVPKYILGITSLRGKVIPVIDLKFRLSLTGTPVDDTGKGKILIVRGPKGPIGAAVDKVVGVVRVTRSDILPPPSHLSEGEVKFIDGIAVVDKRFVSIINMPATMTLDPK